VTTPLQSTRYDRLVRRVMNLVGEPAIVTGVLPDVFPVIELENLPPELLALTGWKLGTQNTDLAPGAGNIANSIIRNPPGSGQMTVVESALVWTSTSGEINWSLLPPDVGTFDSRLVFRDRRFTGDLATEVRDLVAGVAGLVHGKIHTANNAQVEIAPVNGLAVLFPGDALAFRTVTVNVRLTVTYFARERPFEQSEERA